MDNKKTQKNDNFLMQGMFLAIAMMITKIIGVLYKIPLINILGDEGMGFHGYAYEVYAFILLISTFSMPTAVSKLVSARLARNQNKNAYRVFKCALAFAIVIGLIFTLLLFFGADFLSKNMMESPLNAYALRVLAPAVLVVSILGAVRGFFQGMGTMMPTAFSQIIEQIVNAVISIIGASILMKIGMKIAEKEGNELIGPAYGAAGGTLGTVFGSATALAFLILIFMAYKKKFNRKLAADRTRKTESYSRIFKILILTMLPVIFSTAIYNMSQIMDLTIFNKMMSAMGYEQKEYIALQGIFSGKYNTLINVPLAMSNGLASSVLPSLIMAAATNNKKQIHNKIDQTIQFTMLIAVPCFIGFIALASPIMVFLYNDASATPARMLQMGAITVVTFGLSTVTNSILQGLDKMSAPVKNASAALVIHLIVLLISMGVFKWSIYSIVLSNIVFSIVMSYLNIRDIYKACGYRMNWNKTIIKPMTAGIVMGIVTYIVHLLLDIIIGGRFIPTILAIIAAVIVYAISVMRFGVLTEEDLANFPKGDQIYKLCKKLHLLPR